MVTIKSLKILQFRTFSPDAEIQIGKNITLIAGQNGTAKSTILGMICQPLGFSKSESIYIDVYKDMNFSGLKTVGGNEFSAKYSEVFRISNKFDFAGTHRYQIFIESEHLNAEKIPDNSLLIESEKRDEQKIRFVTNTKNREKGAGNFPHPVIYVGLKRLRPLADFNSDQVSYEHALTQDDANYFKEKYSEIFVDLSGVNPQKVETKNFKGNYLSIETQNYDSEGASAGQDNIGQILTAVLSFKKLKLDLGDKYQGGMILIDEIDATLHPLVQKNLIQYLIQVSKELNLQIVATTHSLFMLKEFSHNKQVMLTYLKKVNNEIRVNNQVDYDSIWSDLTAQVPELKSKNQVTVLFEDSVASSFFREVTGKMFTEFISIVNEVGQNSDTCLSNGHLKTLAAIANKKNIPEFRRILFVLDGDSKNLLNKKSPNLLALPGEASAEKEMYELLRGLDEAQPFWTATNKHFSKQSCFNGFVTAPEPTNANSDFYKRWLKQSSELKPTPFGREHNKLFKLWVENNKGICKVFCTDFLKSISGLGAPLDKAKIEDEINKKYS